MEGEKVDETEMKGGVRWQITLLEFDCECISLCHCSVHHLLLRRVCVLQLLQSFFRRSAQKGIMV